MNTYPNPLARMLRHSWLLFVLGTMALARAVVAQGYTAPGVLLNGNDLAAIKTHLNVEPWKSGYASLQANSTAQLSYTMQGPFATVSRNPNVNLTQWRNDMTAVWDLSRMWYFTGNAAYAQKARDILLAWANTQTSFDGLESGLDLGDYAWKFVSGADILRGTWPGWTSANTTTVKNYFANVFVPEVYNSGSQYGAANKGALHLCAAGVMAIFNEDDTLLQNVLYQYRTMASIGLRSSNSIGQLGDTGRDMGHAHGQLLSLAIFAEALWKQGVDLYSENDNRLLACGEYFARDNALVSIPWTPFGTTDMYYIWDSWATPGWNHGSMAMELIRGAYVVRKGLKAPYTELRRQELPVDSDSFMFRKAADTSTATPPATIAFPTTTSVTSGLTGINMGGATPAGSASYSSGIWTVRGGGSDTWNTADSAYFTYKAVTGDFAIVAKVESLTPPSGATSKAGIEIRGSLSAGAPRCWVAKTSASTIEQNMAGGLAVYGGTNYSNKSWTLDYPKYWVKIERVGNIITNYFSPDGTNWAATGVGRYDNIPNTLYAGLVVCSKSNGSLATATFSNVQITGGNGGAPAVTPDAPALVLSSPADNAVLLRWHTSFGAASYSVRRSTVSGRSYTTIASGLTGSSYMDTSVTNGTNYYYVVTATNSAGTSGNSPEDSARPQSPMANVVADGVATASANGATADNVFDKTTSSKWFNNGAGTTGWIQYDFGSALTQTIKRYTVISANDVPERDPKNWQFQGSINGSTWTTLDTQSNQSFANRNKANTYTVASPTAFRYYRLNVTANNGDATGLQLAELALLTDQGATIPDGTYRVLNRNSRKGFEVSGGSTADDAQIVQWSYTGANSQKWSFSHQGNGQYQILGIASGKAAEVSGGSTANLADLIINPWTGANQQRWTATPTGDGFFRLTAVHSGKVADVTGGSTADGASIMQYPYGGGLNQQWSITLAPGTSGGGATTYQTESMTVISTSGDTHRTFTDPNFSGGSGTVIEADAVGDYVTYLLPNVAAGSYNVKVAVKKNSVRGIFQMSTSPAGQATGNNTGSAQDEYAASDTYTEIDLGTWTPAGTGDKWFRFTVTGKNASSTDYWLAFDYIKLTPQ